MALFAYMSAAGTIAVTFRSFLRRQRLLTLFERLTVG